MAYCDKCDTVLIPSTTIAMVANAWSFYSVHYRTALIPPLALCMFRWFASDYEMWTEVSCHLSNGSLKNQCMVCCMSFLIDCHSNPEKVSYILRQARGPVINRISCQHTSNVWYGWKNKHLIFSATRFGDYLLL